MEARTSETTNHTIILTLTEERVQRHVHEPPVVTTRRIQNGDMITLEAFDEKKWTVIIEAVRDNSVAVRFERSAPFEVRESEIVFGEEYEIGTDTLSSWTTWILVFTRR